MPNMESQGLEASGTNEDVCTCTTACTEASAASTKEVLSSGPELEKGAAGKCWVTEVFGGVKCANDALWMSLPLGGVGANHPPANSPAAKIPRQKLIQLSHLFLFLQYMLIQTVPGIM
ncbi:MAG: hypothetical protein VX101_01895 [Bacteroidota bacterium]|nr:hypothetical protein [Bacteroidota bacterium]